MSSNPGSSAALCPHCGGVLADDHRCDGLGDRYAMDADLTLYWPAVRPCWEDR